MKHIENIKEIINKYNYPEIRIINYEFYEEKLLNLNLSLNDKSKILENSNYNNWGFSILIEFEGLVSGKYAINITSGGYWGRSLETLYYCNSYNKDLLLMNQTKVLKKNVKYILRQEFLNNIIELGFDFDKDVYLEFDDKYNKYMIWDKEPDNYCDIIKDGYNDEYKERQLRNLKKIKKCNNIQQYCKDELYGEEQKIEWTEYRL